MTTAYIALGSNLGDRQGHLRSAIGEVGATPGIRVAAVSEAIETEPVGPGVQGKYLNAAARLDTDLGARELLDAMLAVEHRLGRDRTSEQRWGPRTIDLDLLIFGEAQINEPGLIVPHSRLLERFFVLAPLAAIEPQLVVPGQTRTVSELLGALTDPAGAQP